MSPINTPKILPMEAYFLAALTAVPSSAGQEMLRIRQRPSFINISRPAIPIHTIALRRLKAVTDLSITRMSEMLNVERRTLYNWVDGKPISPANESHLEQILSAIEALGGVNPESVRRSLLSIDEHGVSPMERFREGHYQEAAKQLADSLNNAGRGYPDGMPLGRRDLVASLRVEDEEAGEGLPMTSTPGRRLRIAGKVLDTRD